MRTKPLILAALLCLIASAPAGAEDALRFTAQPETIQVGTLYDGTSLSVTGTIPADGNVVLRFLGATCKHLQMKEKGKVFGLMWMNLDSLVFNGVPSVCIVNAAEISGTDGGENAKAPESMRLGALEKDAVIEGEGSKHAGAFDEFVKLKKEEGLYREVAGNIHYDAPSNGLKAFRAEIPVPSRLTPGDYVLEAVTFRNGTVIARGERPIEVKLVGAPALLANLAFQHAALYGALATLIALLGGLAIGVMFQSKGAH